MLQNRLGVATIRDFISLTMLISVYWIGIEEHNKAVSALLTARQDGLSLVDFSSSEIMRWRGIRTAFTIDSRFADQGFSCIP